MCLSLLQEVGDVGGHANQPVQSHGVRERRTLLARRLAQHHGQSGTQQHPRRELTRPRSNPGPRRTLHSAVSGVGVWVCARVACKMTTWPLLRSFNVVKVLVFLRFC